MTRRLGISITALALCGACASARAQDGFPDTPANHWAYDALNKLKRDGLLVGYPDGLFRGPRPATRYEVAVAMDAGFRKLEALLNELDSQAKKIQTISPQDIEFLKDQVGEIQQEINGLKGYAQDIANLRRAADTFELELEQLGVNVEAMKKALGDLNDRVTRLEKKKPPIDISGNLNFWVGQGGGADGYYGLNKDGRIVGTSNPAAASNVNPPVGTEASLLGDVTTIHEAAFNLSGTNDTGPKWLGTLVVSNAFGNFKAGTAAFGNQSDVFNPAYGNANVPVSGLLGYQDGLEDVYLQNLEVKFDGKLGSTPVTTEVGRLSYKIGPYLLQRPDNTSYYSDDRWDNGKYTFDGFLIGFKTRLADVDVFGGRNSGLLSADGVEINPMRTGPIDGPFSGTGVFPASGTRMDIDRSLGADLKMNAGRTGTVSLAYMLLESDTGSLISLSQAANRLSVYGGDGSLHLGPITLDGGYHKSDLQQGTSTVIGNDNSAWNVRLAASRPSYLLYGEYRQVEANYLAPGDWGRLGVLRNPSNVKGFKVGGSLDVGKKWTLSADGEFDKGVSDAFTDSTSIGTGSNIDMYHLRVDYHIRSNFSLYGEYEDTRFNNLSYSPSFAGTGDPMYRWTTFGIGYGINANAKLALQYELSDIDNDYQVTNGSSFRGGFLTTQLTIRF